MTETTTTAPADPLTAAAVLLALALAALVWQRATARPPGFPPGPARWPVVGSLPGLFPWGSGPLCILHANQRLMREHGPVMGYFRKDLPVVLLSDYETMREVFSREEASGRMSFAPLTDPRPGAGGRTDEEGVPGLISPSGREWSEQRAFAYKQLREFGFHKSSMEEIFSEDIGTLSASFRRSLGRPTDLRFAFNLAALNGLWRILVGEPLQQDTEDPKLRKIPRLITSLLSRVGKTSLGGALVPRSLVKLPLFDKLSGFDLARRTFDSVLELVEPYIQEHIKTLDPDDMRDFVDAYLKNIIDCKDKSSSFYGDAGLDSLRNVMMDFFFAGSDTSALTLLWAVLYMIHHPDVQKKVQQELDQVYGRDALPSLSSGTKDALPYTWAVVSETFRKTSVNHMSLGHMAMLDLDIQGYKVPKGTTIWGNLYHLHHDPAHWRDPETFDPTRFLDGSGRYLPNDRLRPFGIGKRSCIGQSLAEKQFFLFLSCLLHQFEFSRVPGQTLPTYGIDASTTVFVSRICPPYQVVITDRNI